MNETKDPEKPIWPEQRFAAIAKHPNCPVCDHDDWWVFDTPSQTSVIPFSRPSTIPTFVRACVRCGYVQQFLRQALLGELTAPETGT
jgi:Zn ribbon nucleic-acid-binding protein